MTLNKKYSLFSSLIDGKLHFLAGHVKYLFQEGALGFLGKFPSPPKFTANTY